MLRLRDEGFPERHGFFFFVVAVIPHVWASLSLNTRAPCCRGPIFFFFFDLFPTNDFDSQADGKTILT